MSSKDAETPDGASGSRWEPTDATAADRDAPAPAAHPRWRPSRTFGVAASAAMAGLVLGGAGGWALGSTGHDDPRERPALVGFPGQPSGDRDGDGRGPGGPGAPGGPGVIPGQPQLDQGEGDADDDGDQSS